MPTDNEICVAAAERWTQCMLRGDFASAWRESDLIEQTGYRDPHKLWNGEAWAGKRIMLRCLHGLGDCIQFVRYAPLLKKTCRYLTVQSHPELVRLMKQVPGVDQAVTWGEGECDWELQMEVMELPRAFRTTIPTIPGQVPYIYISEEQRRWAAQLFHEGHSLRVGLVWQSSAWNTERCIPVAELDPLLSNGRCKFYSLQKGSHAGIRGCDVQRHARDVADTAAIMSQLDLIITVDTMTAHLAGALGKSVWILLPKAADWRWMIDKADSPWYPTATLIRQRESGDWENVIQLAVRALNRMTNSRATND